MAPFHLSLKRIVNRNWSHFRFLDLPGELRNRVYEYVFGDLDIVIKILRSNSLKSRLARATRNKFDRSGPQLSILAVNEQICEETIGFLAGHVSANFRQPRRFLQPSNGRGAKLREKYVEQMRDCLRTAADLVPLVKHLRVGGPEALRFSRVVEVAPMLSRGNEPAMTLLNGVKKELINHVTTLTLEFGDREVWPGPRWTNAWINHKVWDRVKDLRLEGRSTVLRFRGDGNGRWRIWYSGEEIAEV